MSQVIKTKPEQEPVIKPEEPNIKPVELPHEIISLIGNKVVCMCDISSGYTSSSEWSDSTEDLTDMLDEQPDRLWNLSSDSDY